MKHSIAAGGVLLGAAGYLWFMTDQVSGSASSDVAGDYDPASNDLDAGTYYDWGSDADAESKADDSPVDWTSTKGFAADSRTDLATDTDSTDMEGGVTGL